MKKPELKRVTRVVPLPPLSLVVQFEDGRVVLADLSAVVARGGVFERLRDERYFKSVRVANGGRSIAWPNRLDFCADTLYVAQAPRRNRPAVTNAFGARIFSPVAEVIAS